MKFSYSRANLIFFGFLIILLILPIFDRHKIGKFQTQKITTWYTALSHNLPTDGKSKVSSSNKCNKILGQSCRENVWTPNKSDPWGQNTPFCHDIRRAKTTILPVNKILMRFFAWNSFHLPRKFVFKQLFALFCAVCWEPFANKWHFASCNIYTRKLSRSKAHWNVIAFWNSKQFTQSNVEL